MRTGPGNGFAFPPSARHTGVVTAADDLRLLRRYEPVLRFTEGELFLPMPAVALLLASIRDFFIKR